MLRPFAAVIALLVAVGVGPVGVGAGPAVAAPAPTPAPVVATPGPSSCPDRLTPGPPVDTSEKPVPGQAVPPPLPVPDPPVGGPRMGECGLVLPSGSPPLPSGLTSSAWLLADLDTGAVLAAKDPHGRYRPASLLKTLTAYVVLHQLDMDTVVTGTQADADQEGTRVGIGPGGRYTVRQLVYGLLLHSGNDIAYALAMQLGGVKPTLAAMDAAAADLGALDTRAATPSGLDGPGMSTSAFDLATIFRADMRLPVFADAVHTEHIMFPGYGDKPAFDVANDNKLLYNYPGALGGKTGFTDDARHTFVSAAQRDGRRLVVVLMHGEQYPVPIWRQGARLLDYGFALPPDAAVGQLPDPTAPATPQGAAGSPALAAGEVPGQVTRSAPAAAHTSLVLPSVLAGLALLAVLLTAALRRRHPSS